MSQQESEMDSQSNQQNSSNEEDEIHQPQYPYSWSGKINSEGVPRDEPPSSYDAPPTHHPYHAQPPHATNVPGSPQAHLTTHHEYIPPPPDRHAYDQGHPPHHA